MVTPVPTGELAAGSLNARAGLYAAVPDIGLAVVFLIAWIWPTALGPFTVKWLVVVMAVEFIIIHSAAFMGIAVFGHATGKQRARRIVGIGAFYTVFVGAFAIIFRSVWPLTTFWGLTVNRLLGAILGQAQDFGQRALLLAGWMLSFFFYLLGAILTGLLPMPRFGVTPDVVAALHMPGGGTWVEEPWRVMAFGVLYFGLTAWSEITAHHWAPKVRAAAMLFARLSRVPRT